MGISRSIARFAPATAKFLLTALSEHTPFARRFVAQAPLSVVDGGDGGDFTVSIGVPVRPRRASSSWPDSSEAPRARPMSAGSGSPAGTAARARSSLRWGQ